MSMFWFVLPIFALLVAIVRKDLRFQMFLAAVLSIPILIIKPLTDPNFLQIIAGLDLIIFFAARLIIVASFAALAAAVYELFFHNKISPVPHSQRPRLLWLLSGLLFLAILLLLGQSFIVAILAALLVDLIIVIILRPGLIWDVIFSGFFMGFLYLFIYLIAFRGFPGGLNNIWFTDRLSGLTLWSLPVEELLAVVLFGALVGPLYTAIKTLKLPTKIIPSEVSEKKLANPKVIFGWLIIVFSLLAILFGAYYFVIPPKVSTSTPKNSTSSVGLVDDIGLKFNKPINRDVINFSILPDVSGVWHFSNGTLANHLFSQANFTPDKPLAAEQEYTIKVTNIRNLINTSSGADFQFSFRTESLPKIDHASIADGQTGVMLNDPINIYLSQKNNKVVDFNFKFDPAVDFTPSISADGMQYTLKLNQPLTQGAVYKLTTLGWILPGAGNPAPDANWQMAFTTKEPPALASYTPQGSGILTDSGNITLNFVQPMVQDDVLGHISITPEIKGSWKWQTSTKLVYSINQKLSFATGYTILIAKGVHDQSGGFIDNDIKATFTTIGSVQVSIFSPKNAGSNVATDAKISITFDQAVDHGSAERAFSVSPTLSGNFSWSGNKMIFSPDGLKKDSTYNINLAAGIKSISGLDSNKIFSASFSTITSSIILNIGIDYQDQALSCEAASLKMALNYRGVGVTENDIMARIGYDPTIRNGNIWGNPNNAFVGSINGRQDTTGYGVYWQPIARAANVWRSAIAFSGWSPSQIAGAIADNNPVILWGTYGNASRDDWQTPDGQHILAWKGEHARTIIGFLGTADNPTSFVINDPVAGRITWTAAQLAGNMSAFAGSGVVVY